MAEIFKNKINPLLNTKDEEGYAVIMKDKSDMLFSDPIILEIFLKQPTLLIYLEQCLK